MKFDLDFFLKHTYSDNDCLIWTRCFNTDGYPRCRWKNSFNGKVHRIVWELYNQQDPTGYVVRHTCDNPKCINPKHLILGTNIDNVNDRTIRDRCQGLKQKDVEAIKYLFNTSKYKASELAIMFHVSKRTIYYTLNKRK